MVQKGSVDPVRCKGFSPDALRCRSTEAHLDLSRAIIENPVVDIELRLRFGGAKITVPGDAVVDLDDWRTVWKQPVYRVPQHLLSMRSARIVLGTWSA